MELRQYWEVIWKRRWLVLAVVLLAALFSVVTLLLAERTYESETWYITRQEPTDARLEEGRPVQIEGPVIFTYDRYYNWFGSEFLVDDYTLIVESDAFANSVLQTLRQEPAIYDFMRQDAQAGRTDDAKIARLRADIDKLRPQDVKSALQADRRHRELRIVVETGSPELTKAIADAAAIVLTGGRLRPVMGDMVDDRARFALIDAASLETIESSRNRQIQDALIKVLIGIAVALALAFLLEYLDDSVRDERDAKRVLDLPVLGAIPKM